MLSEWNVFDPIHKYSQFARQSHVLEDVLAIILNNQFCEYIQVNSIVVVFSRI